MKYCEGMRDWLRCLKCDYICSEMCPIERKDAVEVLALQLKMVESERDEKHYNS